MISVTGIKDLLISKFSNFAGKKLLPGVLVTFLTVLTVGTSFFGVGKVIGSFSSVKTQQSNISQEAVKGVSVSEQVTGSAVTDKSVAQNGSSNSSVSKSSGGLLLGKNSTLITATPIPTAVSPGGGGCIITLFGKQYNITSLLTSHSGGNVFACGTDMSASYQSRHGTNVSRMQSYLVFSATPVLGGVTPLPINNPTPAPPTSPSAGTPPGSCIITLFGQQYNITSLLTTHSGGNVFACGTDMSASYQSRHGTNVSRMQAYLINNSAIPTPGPTFTPTPTTPPSGSCIVTLFGKQYDITNLVRTHSGGNVFACGTDMSAVYQSRHGTNVSQMQRYLISTSGGGTPAPSPQPSGTPPSTITPTPIRDDGDDD